MPSDFYYAAYSYLDEWMSKDRSFYNVLAFEKRGQKSDQECAKCLVEAATYYGVIRTLKIDEKEQFRLEVAYKSLLSIESLQPQPEDVIEKVDALTSALKSAYGVEARSASSKFLWMAFRSPVVIYDSLAAKWLSKNCDYKYDGYSNYYRKWMEKYREREKYIGAACGELIAIKKFTHASNIPDDEISEWITSKWFMQRVFDHFIIEAASSEDDKKTDA